MEIGLLGITGLFLVCGLLMGLWRGWKRSLVRFIIVLIAIVAAFLLRGVVANAVLQADAGEGLTVEETIINQLPEELRDTEALKDLILTIVRILVGLLLFLIMVFLFKAVSLILYGICKIFVKREIPPKRLLGMVIGGVQGLVLAFVLCVPLNGLLLDMEKVLQIEIDGKTVAESISEDETGSMAVDEMDAYSDTISCKVYTKIGSQAYTLLTTGEKADGRKVTLSGQIDLVASTAKIANELQALADLSFDGELTDISVEQVQDIFNRLQDIKEEMPQEAIDTLNELKDSLAEQLGEDLPFDVTEIDIGDVNFRTEGQVVADAYNFMTGESEVTANELVESLAESTLLLPILDGADVTIDISEEKKAEVSSAINGVADPDTQESLRKLFGLS